MSSHLDTDENTVIKISMKMTMLEVEKHIKIIEALENNKRIQWPAFYLSLSFVFFTWAILSAGRIWSESFIVKDIIVNLSFNIIFAFGFSYALMHLANYKYFASLHTGNISSKEEDKKSNRLFIYNVIIGFLLTILFSTALNNLWIKGEPVSPLIDIAILFGMFVHMQLGLNCWYTIRKIRKITKQYFREMGDVINEFDRITKATTDITETNETRDNLKNSH